MQGISITDGHGASELGQRRWFVLVVASVGVFVAALTVSIVSVALPVISPHLNLSYSDALWVQAAYIVVITIFASPTGRLADKHGPLRLYSLGVLVFGVFAVVTAFSPSGLFLIIARGFQGVGGGLVTTSSAATVATVFPAGERGRALGFNIMAGTTGFALGPPLGGLIATYLGWRWIFLIGAPIAALTLAGSWSLLAAERRDRAAERERIGIGPEGRGVDTPGAILLGITLATLFIPLSFSPLWGWANKITVGLLVAAVASAIAFAIVERRVKDPVLDLGLFRRNHLFAGANAAALLCLASTYGVTIFTAVFLEVVQGHSAERAGIILLTQPTVMAIITPFAGRLSDRVGPHGLAATGLVIVAAGTGQLALVSSGASTWQVLLALATVGLGMALFAAPNMSAVMGSVDRSELGVASGVNATMRGCGQGLSVAMLGAIAASQLGPTGGRLILLGKSAGISSAQAFTAGFREAMLVGSGLAIAGALASLVGKKKEDGQDHPVRSGGLGPIEAEL